MKKAFLGGSVTTLVFAQSWQANGMVFAMLLEICAGARNNWINYYEACDLDYLH